MGYQFLNELNPLELADKVRVRVLKIWDTILPGIEKIFLSVDMLVVDEKGNAMQVVILKKDEQLFKSFVKEGVVYDITNFFVGKPKNYYKAISQKAVINFTRTTKLIEIQNPPKPLPSYYFELQPFHLLEPRVGSKERFTDVIGFLTSVGHVTNGYTKYSPDPVDRRNIRIQDEHGEVLEATLWSASTHVFDDRDDLFSRTNVPVVLSGMIVRKFLGHCALTSSTATKVYLDFDLPEAKPLKDRYAHEPLAVTLLPEQDWIRREGQDNMNENRMTVAKLLKIDILQSKDIFFTCKAKIIGFDISSGWFYKCCKICNKGLRIINNKLCCPANGHGEQEPRPCFKLCINVQDDTSEADFMVFGRAAEELVGKSMEDIVKEQTLDQQVLHKSIKDLINQERIFKINLAKHSFETGIPIFVVARTCAVNNNDIRVVLEPTSPPVTTVGPHSSETLISNVDQTHLSLEPEIDLLRDLFGSQTPTPQKGIRIEEPSQQSSKTQQTLSSGSAKSKLFSEREKAISGSQTDTEDDMSMYNIPLKQLKSRDKGKRKI